MEETREAVQQQAAIVEELQISLAEEESLIQELKLLAQSGELKKVHAMMMRPRKPCIAGWQPRPVLLCCKRGQKCMRPCGHSH